MKKILLLLAASLCLLAGSYAQKEANFWYFGEYAGLNFGLGVPVALTDGALDTGEGCSSISTGSGNLLFYTDGTTVWNKNHQVMENGTGLHGHSSSTQSGLIVPNPSNTNIYYIFTVDARDNNLFYGLQYSVVDISANGGLGRVDPSQKNIPLVAPACEKLTAVGNYVGNGFWVITHEWGTNAFYAFQILGSGVNTTPVISNVGAVIAGDLEYSKGYIKVSPSGEKLGIAHNELCLVEIFDFNPSTGVLSNPISDNNYQIYPGGSMYRGGPYGLEFSPDSKKLYVAEWKVGRKIFQYDLEAGDPTAILNSRVLVGSVGQNDPPIGALQLGPDNRMYIARQNHGYLSRINFPNTIGTGCSFEDAAVYLAGRDCTYGLPPFIQSFFNANVEFFWETPSCFGDATQFFLSASVSPDSVFWNFGDYATGDDNYSTELNPTHLFSDTLNHFVTLTYYLGSNTEVILHGIIVHTYPEIDLGNDSAFCYIEPVILDPGNYTTYLWQDGSTDSTYTVTTSGTYWCEVTNQYGCPDRDTIELVVGQEPVVTVSADATLIPFGTSTGLHGSYTGGNGPFSYQWEPAALVANPTILEPSTNNLESTTTFTLYVTDESAGCTGEQSVTVYVTGGPLMVTATASPASVCLGGNSVLNAQPSGGTGTYTYTWTSNPPGFNSDLQSPTVAPLVTTTYYVVLDDELSIANGQVTVTVSPDPVSEAGDDQSIPYGTSTILYGSGSVGSGNYTWAWSPAEWLVSTYVQNPVTQNLTEAVLFSLVITDNVTGCISEADHVLVTPEGGPLGVNIQSEAPEICHGSSSTLTAYANGGNSGNLTEYTWSDNFGNTYPSEQSITVSPNQTTEFHVSVFDGFNYSDDYFTLTIYPGAYFTLAGGQETIIACPYDTVILVPSPHPADWEYLWSNGSTNDTILVGSTGLGYDIKELYLTTTSLNGCIYQHGIAVIFDFGSCFGTDEHSVEPVRIFPNPGQGTFSFEGTSNEKWSELKIYNVQQQLVYFEQLTVDNGPGSRIIKDLSFLPAGIYFVNLSREGARGCGKLVILP